MATPSRRPSERLAFCRSCDGDIEKGTEMVSLWSWRNRGQHIHFCLPCAAHIGELTKEPANG